MTNTILNKEQAIQELLLLLAEFYKPPTEPFFADLKRGFIEEEMKKLLKHVFPYPSRFDLIHSFDTWESMKKVYQKCFLGPNEPYALPVESIYKVWTTDPTAEILIAGEKGHLFGDSAIHLIYLYKQFGIVIPEQYKNMPDHITLLLEFLALLTQQKRYELMEMFIEDHFDWLDAFNEKLKSVPGGDFYVLITELVVQVINTLPIKKEVEQIGERSERIEA